MPSIARVPLYPRLPRKDGVIVGNAVRGEHWTPAVNLYNHALGKGETLIATYCPRTVVATTATRTFQYRVWPQYANLNRLWMIRISRATLFSTTSTVTFKTPSGGTGLDYAVIGSGPAAVTTYFHFETLSSQTASVADASLDIINNGSQNITVEQISCYALARARLAQDTNEYGVDPHTVRAPAWIYDPTQASYGGVVEQAAAVESRVRRGGLWHWAVPTNDALSTSSGVAANLFQDHPILLGRKLYTSSTIKNVKVYAYCKTDVNGTTGTVDLTMTSGDTLSIAIPTGSHSAYAWFNGDIDVDAEDLTDAKGRRSTRWDFATTTFKTGGSGTLNVAALCIGEDA